MKKITTLLFVLLSLTFLGEKFCTAQSIPFAGVDYNLTDSYVDAARRMNRQSYQQLLSQDPQWDAERAAYENQLQDFIAAQRTNPQPQSVITIPVVVHILWHDSIQDISDSQVYSQLVILNQDYMRLNADTVNTPAPFAAVAGNPMVQFCLAHRDPNGFATTGIERRYTTNPMFTGLDHPQLYSGGGLNQWDPTRYFNIWVCNAIYSGIGEFPLSNTTNTYGAVINYSCFGSNYTSYGTFPALTMDAGGRIATHEIGHCLNLHHTFGDDANTCSGTDFCNDTPNEAAALSGCPAFPYFDSCTTGGNGIMFENYMDYTSSFCKNIFTLDQCARIYAVLHTPPYDALQNSNGCSDPSGIQEISGSKLSIYPNPASALLHIAFDDMSGQRFRMKIYDELGNCILQSEIETNQKDIDISSLARGMYFLELSNSEMSVGKRFIKE